MEMLFLKYFHNDMQNWHSLFILVYFEGELEGSLLEKNIARIKERMVFSCFKRTTFSFWFSTFVQTGISGAWIRGSDGA